MKNKNLFAILAMLVMACLALAGCNNSSSDDEVAGGNAGGGTNPVVETVTVTYDANGHGTAPAAATVAVGSKLTKPADPSADGYTFGGWYKEAECANAWDFDSDTVAAATTLYAKWTVKSYTVTFDANGHGDNPTAVNAEYGAKITNPGAPSGSFGELQGWYKESECINKWDFDNDVVTGDITLYASVS